MEYLTDGCEIDPSVGSLNDVRGDVRGDVKVFSIMDGNGSEPMNESTLMDLWVLMGISLIPWVEGGRSSSSMMQLESLTELD